MAGVGGSAAGHDVLARGLLVLLPGTAAPACGPRAGAAGRAAGAAPGRGLSGGRRDPAQAPTRGAPAGPARREGLAGTWCEGSGASARQRPCSGQLCAGCALCLQRHRGSARGCPHPGAARSFPAGFQASQGPLSAVSSQGNLEVLMLLELGFC